MKGQVYGSEGGGVRMHRCKNIRIRTFENSFPILYIGLKIQIYRELHMLQKNGGVGALSVHAKLF